MLARDLMQSEVITVREDTSIEELCDLFQYARVHGAPVVDASGALIGFVSVEDVLFGSMGNVPPRGEAGPPEHAGESGARGAEGEAPAAATEGREPRARDIMTSPAVWAAEETPVADLCRLMWRLRIHHVPIVREGKVTGIVSAIDLCRAISEGDIST